MKRPALVSCSEAVAMDPPRLAPEIELLPPLEGTEVWFVRRGTQQYFKIKPDLARLVSTIDGATTKRQIADELGEPWNVEQIDVGLEILAKADALAGQSSGRRGGRIRFVPPLTLQFTVCNPSSVLRWIARQLPGLQSPVVLVVAMAVALSGLVGVALRGEALIASLSQPVSYSMLLALLVGMLLTTALHEIGHGLILASYGASPTRLGVMLFYLMPAFFCDVSDGWRLAKPIQRVHVALAGVAVQWTVAGVSGLLSCIPVLESWSNGLTIFTVITLSTSLMNLIPFVKLDGYIALMNYVDVSHLRDKAMSDARGWMLNLLLAVPAPARQLPQFRWAVPFGIACMLFPPIIVCNALLIWSNSLQRLSLLGTFITLLSVAAAVVGIGRDLFSGFSWKVLSTKARARAAGVVAAAVVAVVAALAFMPVPRTIAGGFIIKDSTAELLLPQSISLSALEEGDRVSLREAGIVLQREIGSSTVATAGRDARDGERPFYSLFAVDDVNPMIPVQVVNIAPVANPKVSHGIAVVELGSVPLGTWLLQRLTALDG